MKTLMLDELLAKNPQVDRKEIERIRKAGKAVAPVKVPSPVPYNDRRMIVDDRLEYEEVPSRRHESYAIW